MLSFTKKVRSEEFGKTAKGESSGQHEAREVGVRASGFMVISFSSIFAARASAEGRNDDENGEQNQPWP